MRNGSCFNKFILWYLDPGYRILSCNNEKMSTYSVGSNTVQCCSIWHEKVWPKVTDDECCLFLMAATPVPLHNIFNQTPCMTCCFHHASWFLFLMILIISVPPHKEHTFQPILSNLVISSYLSQAKHRVCCQQPLCLASGARVNIQPDPAASSGQAVWAGSSAGGELHFTLLLNSPRFN